MGARVCVLIAAVCFGTTGTARALGPDQARAVAVGSGRIVLGGVLLVLYALVSGPGAESPVRAARHLRPFTVLCSGACVAVYQLCFFAAVQRTGVAIGTVVAIGSGPVFAGLLAFAALGERPGRRWAVATTLAAIGVGLLVGGGGGSGSVDILGVGLALGAGAGYAAYTVIAKHLLIAGHEPRLVMAAAFGMGGLLLVPVLAVTAGAWLGTIGGLALVAYLGVVPTALAYVLFARGLQQLTAGETTTLTLAEPLTAAALGAVVLGERPGAAAVAGAALVFAGLLALAVGRADVSAAPVPAPAVTP